MPQETTPTGPDVDRLKVPEELLRQLQEADERLRVAREHLEKAMDETELIMSHQHQVEDRFGDLRQAEKDVEAISERINEILGRKV
jgi:hypothetical protein